MWSKDKIIEIFSDTMKALTGIDFEIMFINWKTEKYMK